MFRLCFLSTTEILLNLGLLGALLPGGTCSQCSKPGQHSPDEISTRLQLNCSCNRAPVTDSYSRTFLNVLRQHQRLSLLCWTCCCQLLQSEVDITFWDQFGSFFIRQLTSISLRYVIFHRNTVFLFETRISMEFSSPTSLRLFGS